jgi:hypothetical protein
MALSICDISAGLCRGHPLVPSMMPAHIKLMNLNYESILSDLKNAKKTIASLRQERDDLKEISLKLEEKYKKISKQLEKTLVENSKLKQILKNFEFEPSKIEIFSILEKISEEIEKFHKNKQKKTQFSLEKVKKGLENERFWLSMSLFGQEFLNFVQDLNGLEDLKNFSFNQNLSKDFTSHQKQVASFGSFDLDEDYDGLVNESCLMIDALERQNVKISNLTKNISRISDERISHRVSRSMANLRVPEFK